MAAPRTTIVAPADVIAPAMVLGERWTILELVEQLRGQLSVLEFCARRGLLKNAIQCARCNVACNLQQHRLSTEGYRWKCVRCRTTKTIREGSFFARNRVATGVKSVVMMLYWWSKDLPQDYIISELHISQHTCIDWHNFIRDVCTQDVVLHPIQLGGLDQAGRAKVVEIDESKYFHRKYHRGQYRDGHWVFGAVERETGRCLLQEVCDRRRVTLQDLVGQWILPRTHIMSDGWAAYATLDQMPQHYEHSVVVHENHFVDPTDRSIHTNNIENLWMRAKRKLKRQFGTSRALFPTYLKEFVWRQEHKQQDYFAALCNCIREQYPV